MPETDYFRVVIEAGTVPATIAALALLVRAIGYAVGEFLRARATSRLARTEPAVEIPPHRARSGRLPAGKSPPARKPRSLRTGEL